MFSGLVETPALPILARAKARALLPLRHRAPSTETLLPSTPAVPRPLTPPPVTGACTQERLPALLTLRHLKTRQAGGSPPPVPAPPTRGSRFLPLRARDGSTAGCPPLTWGWGERSPGTCPSTQPLLPVSQTIPTCPARVSTPSAAWPRCPSSWQGRGPAPRPAPPPTLSAPAPTAASGPWATSSPA